MTLELDLYDCDGYITGGGLVVEAEVNGVYTIRFDGGADCGILANDELDAALGWLTEDFNNGYTMIDSVYTKRVWTGQA